MQTAGLKTRLAAALLVALALGASGPAHAAGGCTLPAASAAMEAELIAQLNAERAARGLPALKVNPALGKAAQAHACDNAARGSISHVSSDGSRLQNRLKRAGYPYKTAAENTGRGFASGRRAVEWWMNSPGHRKNMLMSETREIGVGIALGREAEPRLHWVINMGKR